MGNAVSAKNLDLVNAPRAKEYRVRIEVALRSLEKRGIIFEAYGKLVKEVETLTGIHRTNLNRNNTYSGMILLHFIGQKGGLDAVSEAGAPKEVLILKLRQANLDLLAVRRELKEARSAVFQAVDIQLSPSPMPEPKSDAVAHVDFTNLCKMLLAVVDRTEGTIELDFTNSAIVDHAAPPGRRVVASAPQSTTFFKWAKGHQANIETLRALEQLARPRRK